MSKSSFVYVVYIRTRLEKAWQALVQGDVTRQYWGNENVSDWKVGSGWEHRGEKGTGPALIVGEVVEVSPPQRLVLTWAYPQDKANRAMHSRVTFDLAPIEDMIKLTVVHDQLDEASDMQKSITEGWPRVLSSMKSFLETGQALDVWAGHPHHTEKMKANR